MDIGVIDLRDGGACLVRRLLAAGHHCVVYDPSPRRVAELAAERAYGAASVADVAHELDAPRVIWLMDQTPVCDRTLEELLPGLRAGDVIVDGSLCARADAVRRARELGAAGIGYVDAGFAGSCLLVGGDTAIVRALGRLFDDASSCGGWMHCGTVGTGHFVATAERRVADALADAYVDRFGAPMSDLTAAALAKVVADPERSASLRRALDVHAATTLPEMHS